jgi:hypothetical protein
MGDHEGRFVGMTESRKKDDGMLINKHFHHLYLLISYSLIAFRTETPPTVLRFSRQSMYVRTEVYQVKFHADMVKVIDDTNSLTRMDSSQRSEPVTISTGSYTGLPTQGNISCVKQRVTLLLCTY